MDSGRATKRRKLETPVQGSQKSTPTSQKSTTTPVTYTKKRSNGDAPEPAANTNVTNGALSAQESWAVAKAKRLAGRHKSAASEKDVYDDIDGAHPSPRKPAPSAKRKGALDPLRNQKTESAVSSAKKSPLKSAATLGFFKQFHAPKLDAARSTEKAGRGAREVVDAGSRHGTPAPEADAAAGAERSGNNGKEKEDEEEAQVEGSAAIAPKKTFEDEIRELEEAARKEAAKEGESDTPRTQAVRRSATKPVERCRAPQSAEAKVKKPAKRRKANHADHIEPQMDSDAVPVDAMEVDHDSVELQPKHAPTIPRSKPQQLSKGKPFAKQPVFEADELAELQTVLLEKLTGKRPIPLTNLGDEYAKVSQVVAQTVTAGESNSMLVIGARGSGKSTLVNQVLREQAVKHPDDFHVVRLNGFIHIDDKIALREIWRQLGREMELEENDSTSRNYADTLSTLLALLSHPAEQGRDQPDHITKSVIFILDEFDLFASHPRQTLLYNLFDIAQSRKAPIAVLGLTTRVDVAESLEKRVKSRFSHRYVHLSLAKSFSAFQETCKAALSLQDGDLVGGDTAMSNWNTMIEMLLENFVDRVRRLYHTTKSISLFLSSMLLPVATLPVEKAISSAALIDHLSTSLPGSSLSAPDSKLDLLSSLSTLQLALLICAARQTTIHNTEVISFALAYEEYKVLASKAKLQASASGALAQGAGARISGKEVARNAWEDLVDMGLVMEDGRAGGGRVDVGLEEIGMSGVDLGQWGRWCREI